MEKPHGTQREHPKDVLQIIIMASLCPVIVAWTESNAKSILLGVNHPNDQREAAPICPPLHWLKGIRQTRRQQHG